MVVVINDALGITQFITQTLGIDEATTYLIAIEDLTIDDWRTAAKVLPLPGSSDRRTKEAFVKAIVTVFINTDIAEQYVVGNLAILPGLNAECVKLGSYMLSQTWALKRLNNIAAAQASAVYTSTSSLSHVINEQSSSTSPSRFLDEGEYPTLNPRLYTNVVTTGNPASRNKGITQSKYNNSRSKDKPNTKQVKPWVFGANHTQVDNQTPHLKRVCLAVRSGPEETESTVSSLVQKWSELKDLKVDAVSRTNYSTMFRVQFLSPAAQVEKWTQARMWPTRISVRHWVGNPRTQLRAIETRTYSKKIYVGNLSPSTTMQHVTQNMEQIYQQEMRTGPIQKIESFLNESAWANQQRLKSNNPAHTQRKSACVVITSKPGQDLSDIDLKEQRFSIEMKRAIRPWRGPIPWTQEHKDKMAPDALPLTW